MRLRLFLAAALLSPLCSYAQICGGPALLDEDFSGGIPAGWTVINNDANTLTPSMVLKGFTGQWQNYTHLGKRCVANGSQFLSGSADDYLVTPQITLPAGASCLSWKASALIPSNFNEPYEVRVSTTTPTPQGFSANPPLISFFSEDGPWNEHTLDLSAYAGLTVYIAFRHTAAGYAFFLDDIRISTPEARDIAVDLITTPTVIAPGVYSITGTVTNRGLSAITSYDLHWSVNNGLPNTDLMAAVNIAPDSSAAFTCSVPWTALTAGTYMVNVWADNVNATGDQYAANDTLMRVIYVNTFPRKPLFEDFTQASCPGCDIANWHGDTVLNPYLFTNRVTTIQYHVSWPGVDPMYSFNPAVGMSRVAQYGIAYVPHGVLDGEELADDCNAFIGSSFCLDSNDVNTALEHPAIVELQVNQTIGTDSFIIQVVVTAHTDIPVNTLHLYTYLMEDTILYATPPGTNAQTDFYHTARYALPSTSGSALPAMANGQSLTFNFSCPVDSVNTNPAEFRTLAFIQDDSTYYMHQSEVYPLFVDPGPNSIAETQTRVEFRVYPNPVMNELSFSLSGQTQAGTWSMMNVMGQEVQSGQTAADTATHRIDVQELAPGLYLLLVRNGAQTYVAELIKE